MLVLSDKLIFLGKGKVTAKTKGIPQATTTQIRRSARQLYSKLLEMESESDSEDEEDKTFQGPSGIFL